MLQSFLNLIDIGQELPDVRVMFMSPILYTLGLALVQAAYSISSLLIASRQLI
jgi:hypothetical protein